MPEALDYITSAEVNVVSSDWHRPAVSTVPMATVESDVALLRDSDDATFVEYGGVVPAPALVTLIGYLDAQALPAGELTVTAHLRYSVEGPDCDDMAVSVTPTGPTFSLTVPPVGTIITEDVDYSNPGDYSPGDYDLLLAAIEDGTASLRVGAHASGGSDALVRVYEAWLVLSTLDPSSLGRLVRVFPIHE